MDGSKIIKLEMTTVVQSGELWDWMEVKIRVTGTLLRVLIEVVWRPKDWAFRPCSREALML